MSWYCPSCGYPDGLNGVRCYTCRLWLVTNAGRNTKPKPKPTPP